MIFGGMAAWQAAVLLAATAAAAAWLFRLRVRPPRILLPSLILWRRVLDDTRAVTWWERVRRAVSLAITMVLALALALALTRPSPARGTTAAAHGRTLIVLDSSLSMLARTRAGDTRWRRAVDEARRLAAAAADGVTIATTADGILEGPTTDSGLIDAALDTAAPGGGEATWWPDAATYDAVHLLTDGSITRRFDRRVTVHSVFEAAANVAITAFDVRPSLRGTDAGDAYLELANYAAGAQSVHLIMARGRTTVLDRRIEMRAGETLRQIVPLARGGDPILRARIDAPGDALTIDDEAVSWIERARPLSVTVVGQRTGWLARLLARDPDVRATFADPSSRNFSDADVVVFDRWAPDTAPDRPALYFAPPLPAAAEELRPVWTEPGVHPVVRGVDPFTITIDKARTYRSIELPVAARSARGTPLVYAGERGGRRAVVVTFSGSESNLASAPAFPVLVGNALDWLARVGSAGVHRPGPMTFDAGVGRVADERGRGVRLTRVKDAAVAVLRSPGMYFADGQGARTAIAVNAGDPQVSNVMRTSLSDDQQARHVRWTGAHYPWWMAAVALAFALAIVEWWTWQRRITV